MPTYIPLGKIPASSEERKELLAKQVETEEFLSNLELTHIQRIVVEFLHLQKGYCNEHIEINRDFKVELANSFFNVKADIALKIDRHIFCIIKCAVNSLESWERHSIAFCRVVESYQIPYAVITDGETARLIDVVKGEILSEGLDSIISKDDALKIIKNITFQTYPEQRAEREKRILYAFDAIKCSVDFCETK